LKNIQAWPHAAKPKMYHMDIRGRVSRNSFPRQSSTRHIYADFAQLLIRKARALYINDSFGIELDQTAYALDSTTIDLCLFTLSLGTEPKT
jgi:hypothetical protein